MNDRHDYEHQELDLDGLFYWFMNSDIQSPYKEPKLKEFVEWWWNSEENTGLYYKGTRLYFTFDGKKYYVSWTFWNDGRLDKAIKKLEKLGAKNIQINYGELD